MKQFRQFLLEGRSHPELNPKVSTIDQLRKYKDDPDISITFVQEERVGINPKYIYGTPIGVYTYPLKDAWARYNMSSYGVDKIPFAGTRRFIFVIKLLDKSNMLVASKYLSDDLNRDIVKLKTILKKYNIDEKKSNEILTKKNVKRSGLTSLFTIIKKIADLHESSMANDASFRNKLLRELGYNVIYDDCGAIDGSFLVQQIGFLNPKSYQVIDKIENKYAVPGFNITINSMGNKYKKDWNNSGLWRFGIFSGGTWKQGVWQNGIFETGTWKSGEWYSGTFQNGTWLYGTWKDGTWENGTWKNGFWKYGTWKKGTWEKGFIWSEKFEKYVESKVNPKIFYELDKESSSLEELEKKANA